MGSIKTFFLNKLVLRVVYIVAAFSTSHVVSILSQPEVQAGIAKAGLQIKVLDADLLKTWITGTLLVVGEVLYHYFHKTVIMPEVKKIPEVKPQ